MALITEQVRYGSGNRHVGYLARPERAAAPMPGVVVVQELWGVDAHIEDVTRRLAGAGYVALAPDLYAIDGAREPALTVERMAELQAFLNVQPPAVWSDPAAREQALAAFPADQAARLRDSFAAAGVSPRIAERIAIARDAVVFLRDQHDLTRGQKVGIVGFCFGGAVAAQVASQDPALAATVIFYGAAPPAEKAAAIRSPVLGHYGSLDTRLTAGVPAFAEALRAAGTPFEPHIHEGAAHAFFNDGRVTYNAGAARAAWARTLAFLDERLSPRGDVR